MDVGGLVEWGVSHMFILSKCLLENIYSQTKKKKKERNKRQKSSVTHTDSLEGQI